MSRADAVVRRLRAPGLIAALALLQAFAVRAAQEWVPQTLQTAPQPPPTLGCRAKASDWLCKPKTDSSGLPALSGGWVESNPYRGDAAVAATGRRLFNETCAFCHGDDADGSRVAAADLRRLDAHCVHIEDAAIRAWCERDVDAYFIKNVRQGRQYIGIVHMPPWEGTLRQEEMWAIKTFIETRKP